MVPDHNPCGSLSAEDIILHVQGNQVVYPILRQIQNAFKARHPGIVHKYIQPAKFLGGLLHEFRARSRLLQLRIPYFTSSPRLLLNPFLQLQGFLPGRTV